jgi:hypothetical protein
MWRSLATTLLVLLTLAGCRTAGEAIEGLNSDREHGGGYAKVPRRDAEGRLYVPPADWSAGPERVY